MPTGMLQYLATDSLSVTKQNNIPLGGKICYMKYLKTTYDRQYSSYNYKLNCSCKQQDTMPHRGKKHVIYL